MPKAIFAPTGDDKDDWITVDGEIDWAYIPAHTLPRQKFEMPVRLRVGDQSFGEKHIYEGHSVWLETIRRSACELIWEKLSLQGGNFYKGNKANRYCLYVRLSPECLLVLEPQKDKQTNKLFYSIVTVYQKQPKQDEKSIGVYSSNFANPKCNRALRKT